MKKILITGAGGYIGSVATSLFLEKDYEVVAIDNFTTGYREPLELLEKKYGEGKLRFYKKDLTSDLAPFFNIENGIEAVVHYAASCSVDESVKNPQKYFYNNTYGSYNLLTSMVAAGIKQVVFSSTCAVYGEAQTVPIDESHSTNPTNPYGESKRMIEKIIEWYGTSLGLKYVILRYFNVAGATIDGALGDSKKPSVHLIQNAVRGALEIEPFMLTCPEVDTPDKTPIRDYVNVVDLNEAHVAAVDYLSNSKQSEIINIGTGTGNSVLEIVDTVKKVTGASFTFDKTTPRQGETAKMIASIEKADRVLGWKPHRTIEDSITSLVAWYKAHPNGWND